MSTILYKLINGEAVAELCNPVDVSKLLSNGYSTTKNKLIKRKEADTNNTGKLSDKEIKEAAKKAGIKIGRKSIKTLKKELDL